MALHLLLLPPPANQRWVKELTSYNSPNTGAYKKSMQKNTKYLQGMVNLEYRSLNFQKAQIVHMSANL
jgi:hypothetical protein